LINLHESNNFSLLSINLKNIFKEKLSKEIYIIKNNKNVYMNNK